MILAAEPVPVRRRDEKARWTLVAGEVEQEASSKLFMVISEEGPTDAADVSEFFEVDVHGLDVELCGRGHLRRCGHGRTFAIGVGEQDGADRLGA